MLIGYARVSKADGSQVLDLQKDALLALAIDEINIYSDYTTENLWFSGLVNLYQTKNIAIRS